MEYILLLKMSLGIDTGVETSSSLSSISRSWLVLSAGFLDFFPNRLLPRYLQACERSLAIQVCFFFNVDPVARTESIHLKIVFRPGTLARRPSWKWVRKARWVEITGSPFLKMSLTKPRCSPDHSVSLCFATGIWCDVLPTFRHQAVTGFLGNLPVVVLFQKNSSTCVGISCLLPASLKTTESQFVVGVWLMFGNLGFR